MSSFHLLKDKFFAPFFVVQALGAFNDNLFKSALVILLAYTEKDKQLADILIQISAGLFIVPFFIFSAISGQICDKYEKTSIIKKVKIFEISIMLFAFIGFVTNSNIFLMMMLFFMGVHSTLFGPIKYSILPQGLAPKDLLGGNALVGMGTFISILLGTIMGGLLVTTEVLKFFGVYPISLAVVAVAVIGYLVARKIPTLPPSDPTVKIGFNPIKESYQVVKLGLKNKKVFKGIILISWFWFFGFFFLASLPSYCRDILMGDQLVATMLLAMFSVGIGAGSIVCEKVTKGRIDLSFVIVGSLALTIFSFDLYLVGNTSASSEIISLGIFLSSFVNWRVMFDLAMIGFWGGFYIIPLYSFIQRSSDEEVRARMIAINNILNAMFMVLAAILSIVLLKFGFSIVQIFMVVSLMNLVVFFYLVISLFDYFVKFLCICFAKTFYKFKVIGADNIPFSGPFVIVSNHVSFVDWFFISGVMGSPPRFIMEQEYFNIKFISWWFKLVRAIPIPNGRMDVKSYRLAFEQADKELIDGNIVAIFPEGLITRNGKLSPFRGGVIKIVSKNPVHVLPVALKGLWGSWFSRSKGKAFCGFPSLKRREIELVIGELIRPQEFTSEFLQNKIESLLT